MPKSSVLLLLLFYPALLLNAQTQHDFPIDGGNLHVETYGEGDPILIINGGPGMSSEGFRSLAEVISQDNQAIIFDQRGTGKSTLHELNSTTITMNLMVQDIEHIRQQLGIEQWVILGHSFGGMLASYYTTKYPDRTKGLILSSSGGIDMELFNSLNITARLSQKDQDSLQFWNRKIAQGDTSYHARLKRGTFLGPAYLYDLSHLPVIAERLTQGDMRINGLVFQDMRRIEFDCKQQLRSYKNPVLVIQGEHDIIPLSISKRTAALFQHSTLTVLDQSGHYGWLEQPDEYFTAIDKFLTSL